MSDPVAGTDPVLFAALAAFLPGVVATARGHRAVLAIWLMNLIGLGVLFIGTIGAVLGFLAGVVPSSAIMLVALIWALGPDTHANRRRDNEALAQTVAKVLIEALANRENAHGLGEEAIAAALTKPVTSGAGSYFVQERK